MNRLSPETRARRRELAVQFNNEDLDREVRTADNIEGTERSDLLHLLAAARPDLEQRGAIDRFLDDALRGEEFRVAAIRGSGILVAAAWSERLNLDKHIPGREAQEAFAKAVERLGIGDMAKEAHYASNAAVHPDYRNRGIGRRAFAAILGDPAVFSRETAVFYRRSADKPGKGVEAALGAEQVLMDKNHSGGDRHLNMVIASPEVA